MSEHREAPYSGKCGVDGEQWPCRGWLTHERDQLREVARHHKGERDALLTERDQLRAEVAQLKDNMASEGKVMRNSVAAEQERTKRFRRQVVAMSAAVDERESLAYELAAARAEVERAEDARARLAVMEAFASVFRDWATGKTTGLPPSGGSWVAYLLALLPEGGGQ